MLIISISFTLSQELTILLSLLGLNELHNAFILKENQEGNSAAGLYLSICMNLFFIVFLALCTYSNKIRAQNRPQYGHKIQSHSAEGPPLLTGMNILYTSLKNINLQYLEQKSESGLYVTREFKMSRST